LLGFSYFVIDLEHTASIACRVANESSADGRRARNRIGVYISLTSAVNEVWSDIGNFGLNGLSHHAIPKGFFIQLHSYRV